MVFSTVCLGTAAIFGKSTVDGSKIKILILENLIYWLIANLVTEFDAKLASFVKEVNVNFHIQNDLDIPIVLNYKCRMEFNFKNWKVVYIGNINLELFTRNFNYEIERHWQMLQKKNKNVRVIIDN